MSGFCVLLAVTNWVRTSTVGALSGMMSLRKKRSFNEAPCEIVAELMGLGQRRLYISLNAAQDQGCCDDFRAALGLFNAVADDGPGQRLQAGGVVLGKGLVKGRARGLDRLIRERGRWRWHEGR